MDILHASYVDADVVMEARRNELRNWIVYSRMMKNQTPIPNSGLKKLEVKNTQNP